METRSAVIAGTMLILAIVSLIAIVNAIHVKNLKEDLRILKDIAWGESGRMVLQASEMVFENKIKELHMAKEQKETFTDRGGTVDYPY